MKYMGSKARIAKYIAPIINKLIVENGIDHYIEPFVGGANMIEHIACESRGGYDVNSYLIALWNGLRYGYEIPVEMSKEDYLYCRGLVMDERGKVRAQPFTKFFNLGQTPESTLEYIQRVGIEYITEKMDGSLGILYYWNGWKIITRGSFTSDQSQKAYEMLAKYDLSKLMHNATYLLEIVYPENRIVLNYNGQEFLCLLAVMDNNTGWEYDYSMCVITAEDTGFRLPNFYPPTDFEKILAIQDSALGVEGWVLTLKNGSRVKVKTQEYLALHRAIANITTRNLFAVYREKRSFDMVSMYPDEFKEDILNTLEGFKARFYEILHRTSDYFMQISHLTNRREFAEEAKKFMWPNLLFATLDKRDVASMIYDIIEREI